MLYYSSHIWFGMSYNGFIDFLLTIIGFRNGQMIRFFPDEAGVLLPQLFNMDDHGNRAYIDGDDFQDLVKNMNEKLIDAKFDTFKHM